MEHQLVIGPYGGLVLSFSFSLAVISAPTWSEITLSLRFPYTILSILHQHLLRLTISLVKHNINHNYIISSWSISATEKLLCQCRSLMCPSLRMLGGWNSSLLPIHRTRPGALYNVQARRVVALLRLDKLPIVLSKGRGNSLNSCYVLCFDRVDYIPWFGVFGREKVLEGSQCP
ncbi:hypothetical protein BJY04DRAFT_170564 [Aspergillus karnatakaensis]|uniref:uncharacterized protein n=1 Tax=Aspergillus karnatakaensis TaxID=1810916 RepID=UPI003CCE37D5